MRSDIERLKITAELLAAALEALQEHMELIKDQATRNSAKGDQYWAVYSKGVHAILQASKFFQEDMLERKGAGNEQIH